MITTICDVCALPFSGNSMRIKTITLQSGVKDDAVTLHISARCFHVPGPADAHLCNSCMIKALESMKEKLQ